MDNDETLTLPYQLPELVSPKKLTQPIPLTSGKLADWLKQLPVFNIEQLSYQLPKYLQQFNQVDLSHKERFKMLELLRPTVAHLHGALIKQFCGRHFDLSPKTQEVKWLAGELLAGMTVGYQRLLLEVSKKRFGIFNRGQYIQLTERVMFYFCEQFRLAYLLNQEIKTGQWQALNSTYSFAVKLKIHTTEVDDEFAFSTDKITILNLYKQVLFYEMVSPYALRASELEQVRASIWPCIDAVELSDELTSTKPHYSIDKFDDSGPVYSSPTKQRSEKRSIIVTELIEKLHQWYETGRTPEGIDHQVINNKLLLRLIDQLTDVKTRNEARIKEHNTPVEIVMGLKDIDLFLAYLDSSDQLDPLSQPQVERRGVETDWDSLYFHAPEVKITSARDIKLPPQSNQQEQQEPKIRRHDFRIENESKNGACVSCASENGSGLFVGELIFMRGQDPHLWTLGVIRWMRVVQDRLHIGIYLLSANVDSIKVNKQIEYEDEDFNALWIKKSEQGESLILPRAKFSADDRLQMTHKEQQYFIILREEVWQSEGFSQFLFSHDSGTGVDSPSNNDFLISA